MEVKDFEFSKFIESHFGTDGGDAIAREVEFKEVGAFVDELEFLAEDVVAGEYEDLQFFGDDQLVVEEDVLAGVGLFFVDLQFAHCFHFCLL
jgi:hypothetical protein